MKIQSETSFNKKIQSETSFNKKIQSEIIYFVNGVKVLSSNQDVVDIDQIHC